jgi:hypothetical protein
LNGVRLLDLDLADALDVVTHLMVDDQIPYTTVQVADDKVELYHRARVRADLEEKLDGLDGTDDVGRADPETWGTGPEQQAALSALMAQVGPPAGGALSPS